MHAAQVDGFTTKYEKMGTGPLLVLIHGWANTWEAWLPILPTLADHFTLIIPDLPGFGESEGPEEGWTTYQYAVWLSEFLSTIQKTYPNKHLFVAGHSFGGKIASLYEATHLSPHIDKLVLLDASGVPGKLSTKQKAIKIAAHITPTSLKSTLSGKLRSNVYKTFDASGDYLNANLSQQKTLRKILSEDLSDDLRKIETPTLLIWGKHDKETLLSAGNIFHKNIHGSEIKIFESGHFPHHDHAIRVAGDMIEFLERGHNLISHTNVPIKKNNKPLTFSLGTKLAILQQSEYEYPKLADWLSAQQTPLSLEPKEWTIKLKTIQTLSNLSTPILGENTSIRFWNNLIAFPQHVYFSFIVFLATQKLRRLQRSGLSVIAIAGSYAKTSTKNTIYHVLSSSKKTLQTPGNINVMIGIARVILNDLQSYHEVFVVELGEYDPGDIKHFTHFLRPSHKILTPIGVAHLERFKSREALQKEFLSFVTPKDKAITIVHEQNKPLFHTHNISTENIHWYGPSLLQNVEISRSGTEFDVMFATPVHIYIQLLGEHNAVNTLPALFIANSLGILEQQATGRLRTLTPIHARFEPSLLEHNVMVINNGYNSNPGTAIESLKTLAALPGSQKIVITPGFVEMGTEQEEANSTFGEQLAAVCDVIGIVEGANEGSLLLGLTKANFPQKNIIVGTSELDVMKKLQTHLKPNAIILFENSLTEIYKR